MNPDAARSGAARERTGLAWRRTALAFAINGVLLARSSDKWIEVGALIVLALAAGIAAMSATSFRQRNARGWLAGGKRRGEFLLALVGAVSLLDLADIVRQ
ncbi:MAG: hypothetical protein JWN27_3671 [Candidatus Eremiobacteraeota bacterium]|nr:hypothetical protein [Candidatus Eremiobacteraeota bacterium]